MMSRRIKSFLVLILLCLIPALTGCSLISHLIHRGSGITGRYVAENIPYGEEKCNIILELTDNGNYRRDFIVLGSTTSIDDLSSAHGSLQEEGNYTIEDNKLVFYPVSLSDGKTTLGEQELANNGSDQNNQYYFEMQEDGLKLTNAFNGLVIDMERKK